MSDNLVVVFDADTGGMREIRNRITGHAVCDAVSPIPWRLQRVGTRWSAFPKNLPPWLHGDEIVPDEFHFSISEDGWSADLGWSTSTYGIRVSVVASISRQTGDLELRPTVHVDVGTETPEFLTYPILEHPTIDVGTEGDLQFIAPSHSGMMIRRPHDEAPWEAPYPDGYAGCSMQFMALIESGSGGFYLASHDPHSTWKVLRFSGDEWSISHYAWDLREGTSIDLEYPVVLGALIVGDWFEAAERYRSWALTAPWSNSHPSESMPGVDRERRRWLQEEVGLAIWGAPASLDWSPWYRMYGEIAGTPLHICPMWDWTNPLPQSRGREGWFPARFHESNLDAWKGHFVTPYMNDLFVSSSAVDFHDQWEPNAVYPYAIFPFTRFSEFDPGVIATGTPSSDPLVTTDVPFYMCPATTAQTELHAWRDLGLMRDHDMDGVCYDISSGNPLQISRCLRWEHGHPPGRGRHMIEAADRMNRISKQVVDGATHRYLVQGVETIVENIIGSVDFYVARAGAGPLAYHEAWVPSHEQPPGTGRELLPMFEAVYHSIGPVRHDGWLTMAENHGDIFFWAAARIVLQWGGLLSLHYSYGFAFNPPERIDGIDELPEHVNWDGSTIRFEELPELDVAKALFVKQLATARTRMAVPYLAHGTMIRPVSVDVGVTRASFAGRFSSAPTLVLEGTWDVPSVVHGAWQAPNGAIGLMFAAVGTESVQFSSSIDAEKLWGIQLGGSTVTVYDSDGALAEYRVGSDNRVVLDFVLASRRVYLVEIVRDEKAD